MESVVRKRSRLPERILLFLLEHRVIIACQIVYVQLLQQMVLRHQHRVSDSKPIL